MDKKFYVWYDIAFSSLYWSGEELKALHAKGLKKRSEEWPPLVEKGSSKTLFGDYTVTAC